MTAHTTTAPTALIKEVADTAEGVPGVAFLRPGVTDRLRSALSRPGPGTTGTPTAGVRMVRSDGDSPWCVEIHLVALRRTRALDVARAVRDAVEHHLLAVHPAQAAPRVTVTVTGRV
ncbi:hypothetical protein [Streptomyces geranii]|uniref:hypothetical protein n=1 Tax=Streptomyces geranii TaxID=2058923 RepID=UPI000D045323|nr:hypothetical protein [Streptomyces geranii]